jgi:hypothetical protein
MTPVEWGLLVGILAQSVAVISTLVKLVAWVTRSVTAAEQRGWDLEDALREAVRRYAGELDAAAHAD